VLAWALRIMQMYEEWSTNRFMISEDGYLVPKIELLNLLRTIKKLNSTVDKTERDLSRLLGQGSYRCAHPAISEIKVFKSKVSFSYKDAPDDSCPKSYLWRIIEFLIINKRIRFLDCFRIFPSWQEGKQASSRYLDLFETLISKLKMELSKRGLPISIRPIKGVCGCVEINPSSVRELKVNVLEVETICLDITSRLDSFTVKETAQEVKKAIEIYPNHPAIRDLLYKSLQHFSDRTALLEFIPRVVGQLKEECQTIETVLSILPNRLSQVEKERYDTEIDKFMQKLEREKMDMRMLIDEFSSFVRGTKHAVNDQSRIERLAKIVNHIRSLSKQRVKQDATFEKLCMDDIIHKLIRKEYDNQIEYVLPEDHHLVKELITDAFYSIITEEKIAGIDNDLGITEERFQILLRKQLRKAFGKLKAESSLGYRSTND
jgi:hypothetical protein